MKDQVDEEVKQERVHRLIALSEQLAEEYASCFEGEVLEVIPEEKYEKIRQEICMRDIPTTICGLYSKGTTICLEKL